MMNLRERLIDLKLAVPADLAGCSEDEVEQLQKVLDVKLPTVYRQFLLDVGHSAGRLLRGLDAFYPKLVQIQEWARDLLLENGVPPRVIPEKHFVFLMNQGYAFLYFPVDTGEDDPPVFEYTERTKGVSLKSKSLSNFISEEINRHLRHLHEAEQSEGRKS